MDINYEELFGLEPEDPAGEEGQDVADPVEDQEDLGGEDPELADPDVDVDDDDTADEDEDPADEDDQQPEEKPKETPEQRRAQAAARRQREQQAAIDAAVKAERDRNLAEWDAHYKAMNIRDPYHGNKLVESKADYDAYVAERDRKNLERDLKAGKVTPERFQQQVQAQAAQQAAAAVQRQQQQDTARAEVQRQFAELQKAEPGIKSIDEVMRDPLFVSAFQATRDMTKAYRMAHVDEIEARAKGAAQAAQQSGKDHLRRQGTRGGGAPMVTQDVIDQYRIFDPDISVEEIRKHQAQYQKNRKK